MTKKLKPVLSASDFDLPRLNRKCILIINLEHFFMFREFCSGGKVKSFGPSKRFQFDQSGETISVLGGMIGAPLAGMTLENAFNAGAQEFLFLGTAGWIGIHDRDFTGPFSTKRGWDDTGLAADYGSQSKLVKMTPLETVENSSAIASHNAVFRLFPDKIETYRSNNIDLIDMEVVPLGFIANLLGGSFKPVLIISDRIDNQNWRIKPVESLDFKKGLEKGMELVKNNFAT